MSKKQYLWLVNCVVGILISSFWLSGCTTKSEPIEYPSSAKQQTLTPSPALTPVLSPFPTVEQRPGKEPPETTTTQENNPVLPAKDITPPPPDQLARMTLATRLGVSSGDIKILSQGAWSNTAPTCGPSSDEKQKLLFSGAHMQVILSYKNRTYEYWVFQIGDTQFAIQCQ
jgi:hypothetical protein